jgi:hypothetical protein
MALSVASRAVYLNCAFKPGFWSGDVAPTSFYDPINFTKLEITGQVQEADRLISNMEGSHGEALASVNKPTDPAKLSAEADYMSPLMLALLLGSDVTEVTQVTGSVVDEAITPAVVIWIPLANRYIEATGFSAETAADVAVAASNYSVDLINGLFKALNATGATVARVSYTRSARVSETHKAGKAKSSYVMLIGTGTDKVSQRRCRLLIHKASLAAGGAFDPVAGGYLKGTFAGDLLTPSTETSPWQMEFLDLAAA